MTTNELISELRDQADVLGSGTECNLLREAADRMEELDERVAIMSEPHGWISVKDRLPDDETLVLAYVQHKIGWYRMFAWHDKCGWHSSAPEYEDTESKFVTHWMPLPEPPKEDETGD